MQNTNREWHERNKMPKTPSVQRRIKWHLAHEKHCACRPIPEKLLKEITEQRTKNKEHT